MSLPPVVGETGAQGFVLAGGQSSRMGLEKALLPLAGVPLIVHALEILRNAGLDPRIAGARCDLSRFAEVVSDEPAARGLGPLSGICSALDSSSAQYVVFLPVDLPLIPANLIKYLLMHASVSGSAITIASSAGFPQTFPVVIDRVLCPNLHASLRSDDLKCISAFRAAANAIKQPATVLPVELLVAAGDVSHPLGLPAWSWFHNINSPHDLVYPENLFARRSSSKGAIQR